MDPLEGQVESEFLRPVYLGENIAPFRVLDWVTGVVPYDDRLLTAATASAKGWPMLGAWLRNAEELWEKHGAGRMSFSEQLDYYGKLSAQFPIHPLRVIYSKAGTLAAATLLRDPEGIADHKLYWMPVETEPEGLYLCAIINSETSRKRVEHLQSRGQWGARDFDKVLFTLPIPRFAPKDGLHAELAATAREAETVAAAVPVEPGTYFTTARRAIRGALEANGIATRIEGLVAKLLGA
jgi:hypothetical protein